MAMNWKENRNFCISCPSIIASYLKDKKAKKPQAGKSSLSIKTSFRDTLI